MRSSDMLDFLKYIIHRNKERGQRHDRTKAREGQHAKMVIRRRKRTKIPKPRRQQGGRRNRRKR